MKRIIAAFLIASVGIILSIVYLRPTEWSNRSSESRNQIAQVIDTQNDVNRQEEGKLIWTPLRKGDIVYLGDKVKTSSLSCVYLLLKDSASRLEIEENSTVVMSGIGKKLTLNMLEGRVFLKQEEQVSTETKVDLVSGGKIVDVQGDVAVTVAKDGTRLIDDFKSSSVNIFDELEPAYGSTLQSTGPVNLKWKPVKESLEMWVEIGESPALLKRASLSFQGSQDSFRASFGPGTSYWRLVTINNGAEFKSPLMKLNVEPPVPPTLISPADKEVIRPDDKGFDLKWTRGNISDQYSVEVSSNQDFTQVIESGIIKNQTFFTVKSEIPEGDFYWRLKGQSKVSSFKIIRGQKVLSPVPNFPMDGAVFYLNQTPKIDFEWKEQPKARSYEFMLTGTGIPKTIVLTQNKVSVSVNRAGRYLWSVTSQGDDGKNSVLPVQRSFEVRELQKVQWLSIEKRYFYLDSFPIIILKWLRSSSLGAILKISDQPTMQNAELFQVNNADFPFRPLRDGYYYAQISLKDESGQFSGDSSVYEFNVQKAPLPPTPEFLMTESFLKTSTSGELILRLKNREAIFKTKARLLNKRAVLVDERNFVDDQIHFRGLLPGQYSLEAQYIDDYNRMGPSSVRVEILVPEKSMIAAPKIKGIKVR